MPQSETAESRPRLTNEGWSNSGQKEVGNRGMKDFSANTKPGVEERVDKEWLESKQRLNNCPRMARRLEILNKEWLGDWRV